jgi:hypothetical protein
VASNYAYVGPYNGIGAVITEYYIGTPNEEVTVHYYAGALHMKTTFLDGFMDRVGRK